MPCSTTSAAEITASGARPRVPIGCAVGLALGLLVTAATPARGGGPLVVATDGRPVGWDPRAPVPYHVDRGALGLLSNAEAVALVEALLAPWARVPTATIAFERAGALAVDVDASNFGPYLGPFGGFLAPRGQSAIVFDEDGSIFDTLFGVGTRIVGFAGPTFLSTGTRTVPIGDPVPPGAQIVEAHAFLNGRWIDGVNDPEDGNFETPRGRFEAVFVHEFGHLAGLDHTQIHGLAPPPGTDLCAPTAPVETMFPTIVDETQRTLERDDAVALSALYPSADFAASTGRLTGRVLGSDGAPRSGANVIARNLADDADAVSAVAGATLVSPGAFVLAGLTPGARYRVEVGEVDAFHTGGSRVGPFSPPLPLPGPPEFHNGPAESADPLADDPAFWTPVTARAGATESGVDVVLNAQPFTVENVDRAGVRQLRDPAVGDFDGDEILDFVAPNTGVGGNLTRFYRGRGDGTFAAPVAVEGFPGNRAAVAAQLNGRTDRFLDVAVVSETLNEVRVYFGNGAGGFGPPRQVLDLADATVVRPGGAVVRNPVLVDLAAGDLDGNGVGDLVTLAHDRDGGGGRVYALLGSGTGGFAVVETPLARGSGFPTAELAIGALAGSAANDVVGISSGAPPAIGLLVGNGAGGFTPTAIPLGSVSRRVDGAALAVGDLDEDGSADLAVSDLQPAGGPPNCTRSFVDLLVNDGAGGFRLSARYTLAETSQQRIVAADVDGDGHLDLASTGAFAARGSPGARVTVARGDGRGGVRDLVTVSGVAEFPRDLATGDFDGDRRLDLLVLTTDSLLLPAPATYAVLLQAGAIGAPEATIGSRAVASGGRTCVPLTVAKKGAGIAALASDIDFDPAVLSAGSRDCTVGPDAATAGKVLQCVTPGPGRLHCEMSGPGRGLVPDATLWACCFTVRADAAPAPHALSHACRATDPDGDAVAVSCRAGSVLVCEDRDADGACDRETGCAADPGAMMPRVCGCAAAESDADRDGTLDCEDGCAIGSSGLPCVDDGNACTDDQCDGAGRCAHTPNTAPCNDGNRCTRTDRCADGRCTGGDVPVCAAADQCHEAGRCDPATGLCASPARPDGRACDDGLFCTVGETCVAGRCDGGAARRCDGGADACTEVRCDEVAGACVARPAADGTPCDDGDACSTGDGCRDGRCLGGPPPDCDDGARCTSDGCDSVEGCRHAAIAGCCLVADDCDDRDACNGAETCEVGTGLCRAGALPACDDADPCTLDSCTAGACRHEPVGFESLASVAALAAADACDGEEVPRRVSRLMERAGTLAARAEAKRDRPARAARLLRRARALLARARDRAIVAEARGRLSEGCMTTLVARLEDSRTRWQCLVGLLAS